MYARDRVSMEALRRLTRFARTDFTFVVLHGVDKVEHLLWASIQPVQNGPFNLDAILGAAERYAAPQGAGPVVVRPARLAPTRRPTPGSDACCATSTTTT